MDLGVYSLIGIWGVFLYSCYNQHKINQQKHKPSQQSRKQQNSNEIFIKQKQIIINLLSKVNIFKSEKAEENNNDVTEMEPEKQEESLQVGKHFTIEDSNIFPQEQKNLKFNRKKIIFKENAHEKRRKLKQYRTWVQKFRSRPSVGNWETMYKHKHQMNILKQISILAQINESQIEDDVQSYDPFIN